MSTFVKKHPWLLALAAGLVIPSVQARAQCSRGGARSANTTRSAPVLSSFASTGTTGLNLPLYAQPSFNLPSFNLPTGYDMQRQLQLRQQQFAAARLAAQQRQSTALQSRQSLLTQRRERAERTRQQRNERIARAKAKREAARANVLDNEGATLLVSLSEET